MPLQNDQTNTTEAVRGLFGGRFCQALALSPLPEDAMSFLASPSVVHRTRLSFPADSEGKHVVKAWRLRFGDLFGPAKGGVRFHPSVNEASLSGLAARILVKCAVNDLPHGGAAGGVAVEPKGLSLREKETLARAYVSAYADMIGADRDILSPDLGTDMQVMAWMANEYNRLKRRFEPAAVNGKPPGLGGIVGRHGATARGALAVMETLLSAWAEPLQGATCAIQGFGAAGATMAIEASRQGMRVVAVSDSSGGWHDPAGLPVASLAAAKAAGTRLAAMEVPGAQPIAPEAALEVPADWIIAAALAGQLHAGNAGRVACKGVVEIANGAVSDEGEAIFEQRGIKIIPDVVVNAGGITVSHFEWAQGLQGLSMNETEVASHLDSRMRRAAKRLLEKAEAHRVTLPVAAQLMALERIRTALAI